MTKITIITETSFNMGFPGGSVVKKPPANTGDLGLIPGSERFPEEGNGNFIPVFLPGKSHGLRSLVGNSTKGRKRVRHNLATKTTKLGV